MESKGEAGQLLAGRYRLELPLGQGAAGTVWRAEDQLARRAVAVKLATTGAEATWREYAVLCRLRHPGLAAVYDVGREAWPAEQPALFIVSELVDGETFDRWITDRPLLPCLVAMCQLLGTLDFIHRREVLHRDIKPGNLLVAGGQAKLVDFGLATSISDAASEPAAGTVGFVAPEVLVGRSATARSDLYAVGALLHLVLWQRLPFGGSAADVVKQQLAGSLTLPDGGAAGLRELVSQALALEPGQRPASAAEMLEQLITAAPGLPPADQHLVGHGLPEPSHVGRVELLEALAPALAELSRGTPPPRPGVLVVGRPGAGVSRFAHELATAARLEGIRVLRQLPGSPGERAGPAASDPAAERARAVSGVVAALEPALEEPTLLALDEHVDDSLLADVLLALAQRSAQAPLMICVTDRDGGTLDGRLGVLFERLELGPLSAAETTALAASMLPQRWLTPALGPALQRRCGGNPGRATALLRLAVAQQLAEGGGGDALVRRLEAEASAPGDIPGADGLGDREALASARLAALAPAERSVVALVAIFDGTLARSTFEARDPGASALEPLLARGTLLESDGGCLLVDRALGRAALGAVEPEARAAMVERGLSWLAGASARQRAALAVAGGEATTHAALVLEGAREARVAGELALAARLLFAAPAARRELAEVLLASGRAEEACAALAAAVEEASAAEMPAALWALADARLRAGDPEAALAALASFEVDACGEQLPGDVAARLTALSAKALLFAGRYDDAATRAGELAEGAEGEIAAEAGQTLALARCYQGQLDQAREWGQRALELAEQTGHPLLLARVLNSVALIHQQRFELEAAARGYARCEQLAEELGHLPFAATFIMNGASVAQQQGLYGEALARYQRSLSLAERFGGAREMAQVLHNTGRLLVYLGQPARALHHLGRSRALAESLGWRALVGHDEIVAAEAALALGEPARAEQHLARARAIFDDEVDEPMGRLDARLVSARITLARGDRATAARLAAEVRDGAGELEALRLQAELVACAAELATLDGQEEQAAALRSRLVAAEALAHRLGEQDCRVELGLLLARAHAACGDAGAAEAAETEARRRLEQQAQGLPPAIRDAFRVARAAASVAPSEAPSEEEGARMPTTTRSAAALDAPLLAALLEINKELNAERDLTRLLERIIDHAVELTGAERGFLLIRGSEAPDGQFGVQVARNIDQERIPRKELKVSHSIAEEVLRTGQPLVALDALDDERFERFRSVHQLRLRSVLCVPMTIRRLVRGAIYVDNRFQVDTFDPGKQQLLTALADQAALAVGNWELNEENRTRQLELERQQLELERLNEELRQSLSRQRLELDELTRLAQRQRGELEGRYRFESLVGRSAAMREVFGLIARVNDAAAPVFVYGESGTGKELVCKAIHYSGARKAGPFVTVNCGAIPPSLLEGELFGYVKGAFTGADRPHRGLFERADGGTLLLDEVGDMSPELQVKLLRVLQDKRLVRLGDEQEIESDFRLLAASNKDLGELVRQGRFREDLFYRINVITIALPPLRERREDIPLLVDHLLRRHGGEQVEISSEALRLLLDFEWRGNARELENEVLRLLALGGSRIEPADLSAKIVEAAASRLRPARRAATRGTLKEATLALERQMASEALRGSRGSVTEAAKRLGMSRVGLHKLLKRHGLGRS